MRGGIADNIEQFYKSIPSKHIDNKVIILEILKLEPKIYKFLPLRYQTDIEIATIVVKGSCKMIAYVPKSLHFNNFIIKAFLYSCTLMNGRTLIYKFKFLTGHNLNVNEIIKKFIDVLSVEV